MRGYGGGHLGDRLEDYVDGVLSEREAQHAARHVLSCRTCREDVEAEREVLRRLRTVTVDPQRHADLVAGLLAVAPAAPDAPAPLAACGSYRASVALVSPDAPARYSRRRRSQFVGAAAVALGCVGIVAVGNVTPQRTAPGEEPPVNLSSRHMLNDDVRAPQVQAVTFHGVPWAGHSRDSLRSKGRASGTIAP